MLRLLGFSALVFAVAGCGVSPRRSVYNGHSYNAGGPGTTPGTGPAGGAQVSSDPRQALEQVDSYLSSQGYTRIGPAVRNQNLPANGVIAYGIDAQAQLCYTIVALAQPGADLNMIVQDPAGRQIGYDVNPDPHPWVTACPGQAGRAIARLQMASGGGEYYYAVYQGSPQSRPDLAAFFSGGGGQAQEQTVAIDPQTAQRLQALDQTMAQQSYQRISDPYGVAYQSREDRNFALNLEEGSCYSFATLGGAGARDTDVFLVDGSGNELARDVSTSVDANVQFCPTTSGQYTLRTRLYDGTGPVFTVGYVQARGGQQPATQQTNVIAAQSTAGAGLEENFRLLDADMRARGYEGMGDPTRGSLSESETRDFSVSLEGGKCYAILAVGDNGVRDLDLILSDPRGRQIDRDVEEDPRPIVRVCPEQTGDYTMQIKMFSGAGNFVYAPYRWPRGTRGPFGLAGLMYVRLAEVTQLLEVEGYQPDVDATPGRGRVAREGQSRNETVQLEQGQCYSILVVGGQGVNDLNVSLLRDGTPLATDGSRNAFPSVRYCADQSGRYTLKIEATSGSGDYFYQTFRRGS